MAATSSSDNVGAAVTGLRKNQHAENFLYNEPPRAANSPQYPHWPEPSGTPKERTPSHPLGVRSTKILPVIEEGKGMEVTGSSNSSPAGRLQDHSIYMPAPDSPADPKLPLPTYLSDDQRKNFVELCLPLYKAALKGDWEAAQNVIDNCSDVLRVSITKNNETALHIASSATHTHFVAKLVKLMKPEDMERQNNDSNTALCLAAAAGTVKIAQILVENNAKLLRIRGKYEMSPILIAASFGRKDMVSYLYSKTDNMKENEWSDEERRSLLHACVSANQYDIALKLLQHHKEMLALATDDNALHVLARNPSAFSRTRQPVFWRLLNTILPGPRIGPADKKCEALEIVKIIWEQIVELNDVEIGKIIRGPSEIVRVKVDGGRKAKYEDKTVHRSRLLFVAAAFGNTKLITELIQLSPELIWKNDDNGQTLFHVAVSHRQESVYNLLYEIGAIKDVVTTFKDTNGNNILHLAAILPEQTQLRIVSGVALQMQREILWYKEVESMVQPSLREMKNKQGKTPRELFTEEHTKLMEKGESWMKETASQCMVVAALITTIMFAAAFTLPGGNNNDNGNPIFKKDSAFMVFIITDAISLFSSSSSILMFLAILTARYTERDFLASLPIKLMVGLLALLISIATMMIAFSASFFLVYTKGMKWLPYLITGLAASPVVLFVGLQFGLFYDVVRITFSSRFLFKPKKHMLY